ncbi:Ribonuclease [Dirofilaria immitis]
MSKQFVKFIIICNLCQWKRKNLIEIFIIDLRNRLNLQKTTHEEELQIASLDNKVSRLATEVEVEAKTGQEDIRFDSNVVESTCTASLTCD